MESLHLNVPLSVIQILGALFFLYLFIFPPEFSPGAQPQPLPGPVLPQPRHPAGFGAPGFRVGVRVRGDSFGAALINAELRVGERSRKLVGAGSGPGNKVPATPGEWEEKLEEEEEKGEELGMERGRPSPIPFCWVSILRVPVEIRPWRSARGDGPTQPWDRIPSLPSHSFPNSWDQLRGNTGEGLGWG